MSYCRWAGDCDVYVYEDVRGGWTTHVAARGLPHDKASFNDPTPGACADRLDGLRALGYVVPQQAIDELRQEQSET